MFRGILKTGGGIERISEENLGLRTVAGVLKVSFFCFFLAVGSAHTYRLTYTHKYKYKRNKQINKQKMNK